MKRLRILNFIMKRTHMYPIIMSFLGFIFVDAFVILMAEPGITSYGDALWYCYVVMATVGFGDLVAVTFIGRIASVLITIYALFVFAMATGVVVNFHAQLIEAKQKETLAAFVDKMQHLPELSKKELTQISENVKKVLDNDGI